MKLFERLERIEDALGEHRFLRELLEAVANHRGQQRLLGGEVPVHGADADACVRGDVVHLCLRALASEQLATGGHDPLAVASGIGSECSLVGRHHIYKRNLSSGSCYKQVEPYFRFRITPADRLLRGPR